MSTHSTTIEAFARQLLGVAPVGNDSPVHGMEDAVRACEKLRLPLSKLSGPAGYASLLSRALTLAARRAPGLAALRVAPEGQLVPRDDGRPVTAMDEIGIEVGVTLMTELLRLLVTIIGDRLTLTLVREAWPDLPLETLTLRSEDLP